MQVDDLPQTKKTGDATVAVPPPAHLRRAKPALVLLAGTKRWIDSLPSEVQPQSLARHYARIANQLCAVWQHPPACREYFAELLTDRRGGRKGFPPAVLRDIHALHAWHAKCYPESEAESAWDGQNRSIWDGPERG